MLAVDERENFLLRNGWAKTYVHSIFSGCSGWRYAYIGLEAYPATIGPGDWRTLDTAWTEERRAQEGWRDG